ncbi:MAG: 4-hydroxy-tetrahydrodipicolinate reductase, partial [Burkholderiaceae bacterium]|nr:4-hydroxy-tetrahydrodipicolinate reductase [Burkholderiaceae bacterium]
NVLITDDLAKGLVGAEYLIDFTRPEGTLLHLEAAKRAGVKMIVGTTGFTPEQLQQLRSAADTIAMVFAPNMSVGVNAILKILQVAAQLLKQGYDIEIVEAHHRHKVDAPSGTAIKMGEVIAKAQGHSLADLAVYAREGHTGERKPGSIGFATIRGGDIVGDHTVIFAGEGERIEISHRSTSRQSYAEGALRAATFLQNQSKGWFDMQDVLGLK